MSTIQNKKIVAKEYPSKDILSNNKYSIDISKGNIVGEKRI